MREWRIGFIILGYILLGYSLRVTYKWGFLDGRESVYKECSVDDELKDNYYAKTPK